MSVDARSFQNKSKELFSFTRLHATTLLRHSAHVDNSSSISCDTKAGTFAFVVSLVVSEASPLVDGMNSVHLRKKDSIFIGILHCPLVMDIYVACSHGVIVTPVLSLVIPCPSAASAINLASSSESHICSSSSSSSSLYIPSSSPSASSLLRGEHKLVANSNANLCDTTISFHFETILSSLSCNSSSFSCFLLSSSIVSISSSSTTIAAASSLFFSPSLPTFDPDCLSFSSSINICTPSSSSCFSSFIFFCRRAIDRADSFREFTFDKICASILSSFFIVES